MAKLADLKDSLKEKYQILATPDISRVFSTIREVLEEDLKSHFRDQVASDGTRWSPVKGDATPLVKTGDLLESVVQSIASGLNIDVVANRVTITIDPKNLVPYAPYQNDGTSTIPAREFWYVSESAMAKINGIILDEILRQLREAK